MLWCTVVILLAQVCSSWQTVVRQKDKSSNGMCIVDNEACNLVSSKQIAAFADIHNQMGCIEKCFERANCKWWTWFAPGDDSQPNQCVLFNSCVETSRCKFCYTGPQNCSSSGSPQSIMMMAGLSTTQSFVPQIEILLRDHVTPVLNNIQDVNPSFSSGAVVGDTVGDQMVLCGSGLDDQPLCLSYKLPVVPNKPWTVIQPWQIARKDAHAITFYGELYVLGGRDNQNRLVSNIEAFNPYTGKWRQVTPSYMNGEHSLRSGHCVVRYEDVIYMIGGDTGVANASMTVDVLNVTSATWKQIKTNLPPRQHIACCIRNRGPLTIFVSGGVSVANNVALDEAFAWNPRLNQWTSLGRLLTPRSSHVMDLLGDSLFVAGGLSRDQQSLDSIEVLLPENMTWSQGQLTLAHPRNNLLSLKIPEELIYLPTG